VLSQKQFGSGQEGRDGGSLRVGSPGIDGEVQEGRRRRHLRGVTEF
jgi:hypothetical protein